MSQTGRTAWLKCVMFADGGWADMRSPGVASLLSVAVCSCRTGAALAAVCKVLSTPHPNIQDAVNDNSFTEMVVAAGTFVESVEIDRSLEITGNSSTTTMIEGGVVVTGAGVELTLNDQRSTPVRRLLPGVIPSLWRSAEARP